MIFDSKYFGPQELTDDDRKYSGSRYSEVRKALLANSYYLAWGAPDEPPLPVYEVTLRHALRGILPFFKRWGFQDAAKRTVDSQADMRWGQDRRGFRRILHPNGVCLMGEWIIDDDPAGTAYSGYFQRGSKALIIARYSTCCTETRRGRYRSLAMVGKLYPTTDPQHPLPLRTANFITQEDLGGAKTFSINKAELRNAPDTTPWRRGLGLPILLLTALVLRRADLRPTFRQLYEIAELGKPQAQPTNAPEFMRLIVPPEQRIIDGQDLDFRDEVLAQIYDKGNRDPQRTLTFNIEVASESKKKGLIPRRRVFKDWQRIGRIVFKEAVASYNGDFVIHFHHPPWRNDRNDPASQFRSTPRTNV